jgi:enamine deaminase RidA (YjgF/YER057c/UK114 family)
MNNEPTRQWVGSGTAWEATAGYARASRVGNQIFVAGTTGTASEGANDAAAQARVVIDTIEAAITRLGGTLADVVRTRVYVADIADAPAVMRVHGERFAATRPVATLVEARLVAPELLVEIEAEAVVGSGAMIVQV